MHATDFTRKIEALQSTGEVIADTLREMILEGKFKPGEPLRQDAVADLFGVSRVPVRDALNKLVAMQLAVSVPRKGIVVHPLSKKLLKELFEVRVILEGAAAEQLVANTTAELVESLEGIVAEQKEALGAGDVKRSEVLDDRFHRALRSCIDNLTLGEMIEANWMRIKQSRCASALVLPESGEAWMKQSIARHERLLEALKTGKSMTARKVVTDNIRESYGEVIATLEKMGWLE